MVKLSVLYSQPTDPSAFDDYYHNTHIPLAQKMPNVANLELTKGMPGPDGSAPAYYLTANIYYNSVEDLQASLGSPEGQAAAGDIQNFATGGATMLVQEVLG